MTPLPAGVFGVDACGVGWGAQIGKAGVVLVVEPLARKTGLGIRFGTWLLERGLAPKYGYMGVTREGSGGLWEQVYHQVAHRPHPAKPPGASTRVLRLQSERRARRVGVACCAPPRWPPLTRGGMGRGTTRRRSRPRPRR